MQVLMASSTNPMRRQGQLPRVEVRWLLGCLTPEALLSPYANLAQSCFSVLPGNPILYLMRRHFCDVYNSIIS